MQQYVAGLLFDSGGENIALILKNRPDWQSGKFNVIGGKWEKTDANYHDAMKREALEEAGVDVDWEHRFTLTSSSYCVHFFSAHTDLAYQAKTMESEPIVLMPVKQLPGNLIPNLFWIIPMLNDPDIEVPKIIRDIS